MGVAGLLQLSLWNQKCWELRVNDDIEGDYIYNQSDKASGPHVDGFSDILVSLSSSDRPRA